MSEQKVSVLHTINETTNNTSDKIEELSDKIDVLYTDVQKLNEQNSENYELICKLFAEITAPAIIKTRAAKKNPLVS